MPARSSTCRDLQARYQVRPDTTITVTLGRTMSEGYLAPTPPLEA
jgi:hypothetical protein